MSSEKERVYDFLRQNRLMALATSSIKGKPEVATVEYVMDGDELLVNTYVYYRKYKNLLQNPLVACVVTQDEDCTLQFDGRAEELSGKSADDARQKMIEKEPGFESFFNDKDTRFFRITPVWMRLREYTGDDVSDTLYEAS